MKQRWILILVFLCLFFSDTSSPKKNMVVKTNSYLTNDMTITSKDYLLEDSYIKFVKTKTEKEKFLSGFQVTNAALSLNCNNGTNYVGSACSMQVKDLSMQTTTYSVVVAGDVTGDGNNTITDIVKVATYTKDQNTLTNPSYILAADINQDNSVSTKDTNSLAYYTVGNMELPISNDPTTKATIELVTKTLVFSKGSSSKLEINLNQSDASVIEWKSSDESIVSVDSTGLVTGVNAGKAKISVKASTGDTASVQANIIVVIPPTGITLSPSTLQMDINTSQKLSATISPSTATNKTITWKSSNTNVVTVDSNGIVKAVSSGNATITAITANGKTATTNITVVVPASKITLNQSSLTLVKGMTETLTATITPTNVSNKGIKWSSNNTSVATVDQNGKVTAVGNGLALITATTADGKQTATCNVKVEAITLTLSSSNITLMDEKTKTLTATVSPSIANQSVSWKSSDTTIATVSETGKIKAEKSGTVTITATSLADSSVIASCTVTVRARRILFVGNSKTNRPSGSTIPKWFVNISENAGYEFTYAFAYKSGKSLKEIYSLEAQKTKMEKSYDYIVLQEATAEYSATDVTDYYEGVTQIVELVKSKNSNVNIYIRKLWVRQNSTNAIITQAYNNTNAVITKLYNDYGYSAKAINDGPAYYDVNSNYSSISVFVDDQLHQNANGAYLSSLCVYATILEKDPTKITYVPEDVTSTTANTLKTIAKTHCYTS